MIETDLIFIQIETEGAGGEFGACATTTEDEEGPGRRAGDVIELVPLAQDGAHRIVNVWPVGKASHDVRPPPSGKSRSDSSATIARVAVAVKALTIRGSISLAMLANSR